MKIYGNKLLIKLKLLIQKNSLKDNLCSPLEVFAGMIENFMHVQKTMKILLFWQKQIIVKLLDFIRQINGKKRKGLKNYKMENW